MINHLDEFVSVIGDTAKEYLDAATTYQEALELVSQDLLALQRDVKPENRASLMNFYSCVSSHIKTLMESGIIPKP